MSETIRKDGAIISQSVGVKRIASGKFFIPGVAILAIAILIAGLSLLGYMKIVWKGPVQKVQLAVNICGDDIVTAYNNAASYKIRDTSVQATIDEKGLKTLGATIKSKSDYKSDPTCQMILLMTAIHDNDYKTAQQTYQAVKELHAKHLYTDSNLNTGGSLSTYESLVQQLSPANQSNQEPKGGA